ncbi:MAG: M48 family metallopeptidase [Ignavibacteriales bacterium]|nr:M48 family metallopeptidase [Ignavibacteriales bacterium]
MEIFKELLKLILLRIIYLKNLHGYAWEFNVVESEEVNAWCMPGGKVVVYTGILPITKDETGLAVVMGHEIAHAVAQHGAERMSQGLLQQLGGVALSVALANEPARQLNHFFMTAYGVGTTVGVMLPFSRTHESEADRLGLVFMAMAGYDPNAAVDFWTRMSQNKRRRCSTRIFKYSPFRCKHELLILKNICLKQ